VPLDDRAGEGEDRFYYFEAPANAPSLTLTVAPLTSSSDLDLYMNPPGAQFYYYYSADGYAWYSGDVSVSNAQETIQITAQTPGYVPAANIEMHGYNILIVTLS